MPDGRSGCAEWTVTGEPPSATSRQIGTLSATTGYASEAAVPGKQGAAGDGDIDSSCRTY